ncbi:MAG: dihydrodipicolinate synthase family protein [Thermoplasmata archaeon]|nr:dihydrodipicolinate synthase family protein [Thermoplasmata archaeon]MCI4356807.1 dihydrodipicolinate synthase family protein [Thermoplasmata archaeon]
MLSGLVIPVPTLFDESGALDPGRNGPYARALCTAGADHLFVLGSLGEFPTVEEPERRLLVETDIESLTGKTDAWIGIGAPSTRLAVRYATMAEELGAAALVAVPPYYLHPTPEAIAHYYRAIRDATKIPLLAYNIPSLVGYPLPPELVHRLARERILDGLKDTAGYLASVLSFLHGAPEGFPILPGDDALAAASIENGASGAILGTANVVPKLGAALVRAARAHETARANELQILVTRLAEAIHTGPFPSTGKFLSTRTWGARIGYRAPYEALTPEEERTVLAAFDPLLAALRPFL